MKVIDLELADCELYGDGGFSRLRRCRVRNVLEDGSRSPTYLLDMVERPGRADAVAVLPCEPADPVRVLLRRGLRPALRLARSGQPTREGTEPGILHQIGLGLNEGARLSNLTIIGGETASLPDIVYGLDLAGTCLGFVRKEDLVRGDATAPGDVIIGFPSSS